MQTPFRKTRGPAARCARIAGLAGALALAAAAQDDGAAPAGPPPPPPPPAGAPAAAAHPLLPARHADREVALAFRDAPLDQVAAFYAELTGRTVIEAPGLKATVNLRSAARLPAAAALEAVETALALQGVALVPMGDRFLKAVPLPGAGQEGMAIRTAPPAAEIAESDRAAGQVFLLRHIEIAEAQPVVQGLLRATGRIQPLERINGMVVTDTALNLKRVAEILEFLDQPMESRVETRVYELGFAKARDVAARLSELVQESQTARTRTAAPAAPALPSPPGVIRAPRPAAAAAGDSEGADRGLLQGRVKVVADERSNVLIVVSLPENFVFFDRIVAVLDRKIEPGVVVRAHPLEYAKAEEIAALLNSLVGAASRTDTPAARADGGETRSRPLEDAARDSREPAPRAPAGAGDLLGALSPNTKILADKRTNMLLLMGPRADVAAIEEVVGQIDIATAQVLIEAVIIEVRLAKGVEYGLDWLQRSLSVYNVRTDGPMGGVRVGEPVMAFGGGQRFAESTFRDGAAVGRNSPLLSVGGLSYFTTLYGLNLDVILRAAASSSDARILSTPVVQTSDNTEAKIVVGEERPVVTSTSVSTAGQQTTAYQYRNIGLDLSVTPRINPEGVVVMEVAQTADNLGGFEVIDGNRVPVITKREIKASIVAPNRATIVLGGLVNTDRRLTRAKVPILGSIPLLGMLFRSDRWEDSRTELLVLLTPYVLKTPEQARAEARRLYESGGAARAGWTRGWTDSELADPPRGERSVAPRVRVVRRAGADDPPPAGELEIKSVPDEGAETP